LYRNVKNNICKTFWDKENLGKLPKVSQEVIELFKTEGKFKEFYLNSKKTITILIFSKNI